MEIRHKISTTLDKLENMLSEKPFFGGNEASLADILFLTGAIQVTKLFGGGSKVPTLPRMYAWFVKCSKLPGYNENVKGGRALAKELDMLGVKLERLQ
jgi:glutathione S-transferase